MTFPAPEPLRILIAIEDPTLQQVAAQAIQLAVPIHRTRLAVHSSIALAMVLGRGADLLILDRDLPPAGGIALLRTVLAHRRHLPAILTAAQNGGAVDPALRALGVRAVIPHRDLLGGLPGRLREIVPMASAA